jgi:hypothetical protein
VTAFNPRLTAALSEQLDVWRATLAAGAQRVGWKLGVGDRERIGGEIAVGHLTTATLLEPGGTYVSSAGEQLHADAEIAVELGRDVDPADGPEGTLRAIAGYRLALELVDLAPLPGEPDSIVAANVFHRAVAFGPLRPLPSARRQAMLLVNGERRGAGRIADDLGDRLRAATRVLDAAGERFSARDRIITGSIVQVAITVGDDVTAVAEGLGSVGLSVG